MGMLIADSGSTKTEWSMKVDGQNKIVKTEGLNPYYHTTQSIKEVIRQHLLPRIPHKKFDEVFFYGAGCDCEKKNKVVLDALEAHFTSAHVSVRHDLLAAARACFLDEAGIACILGTGSNSCLYDGQNIVEHIPSLAFVLGDEGSAGYFGKKLINKYYRKELPAGLEKALEADWDMSLDHINQGVYENPHQSRFVASYASFLGEHDEHPFVQKMLYEGLENFIRRIVMKYRDAQKYEVRFIGSVAFAYQDMIEEILRNNGMKSGMFVQKPMKRLVNYHSQQQAQVS